MCALDHDMQRLRGRMGPAQFEMSYTYRRPLTEIASNRNLAERS